MTLKTVTRDIGGSGEVMYSDAVSIAGKIIMTDEIAGEMKSPSTAVLMFFMDAEEFSTVSQIFDAVADYTKDSQKQKLGKYDTDCICADFRKIFWCTAMKKWKVVNFYFDTDSLTAHKHGYNRTLLEPYMGANYICSGATDGNHFDEEQSRIAGCIKLCDISQDFEAVYYEEVITEIAYQLQKIAI